MGSLRLSMLLFGAIQMAEGAVMWLLPATVAGYLGVKDFDLVVTDITSFASYLMAFFGAALIAAGFLFIIGGFNPYKNVNAVRFAILWSALSLAAQIYAIGKEYTSFGAIWLPIAVTAIFLLAFIVFFPWPWRRESYK